MLRSKKGERMKKIAKEGRQFDAAPMLVERQERAGGPKTPTATPGGQKGDKPALFVDDRVGLVNQGNDRPAGREIKMKDGSKIFVAAEGVGASTPKGGFNKGGFAGGDVVTPHMARAQRIRNAPVPNTIALSPNASTGNASERIGPTPGRKAQMPTPAPRFNFDAQPDERSSFQKRVDAMGIAPSMAAPAQPARGPAPRFNDAQPDARSSTKRVEPQSLSTYSSCTRS